MIEERELVERAVRVLHPPQPSLERLIRRRDRKRRNQRIGTVVMALVIAVVAIGAALSALRERPSPSPASTVHPSNVDQLRVAWKAPSNGTLVAPTVSNGVLYVASYGYQYVGGNAQKHVKTGRVYAYPVRCATGGSRCPPLWYGETKLPAVPFVSGNSVYALTSFRNQQGRLFSFPVGCATDGSACTPTWTAFIGKSTGVVPVVVGNVVYVAGSRGVFAFSTDCGSGGSTCKPLWVARTDLPVAGFASVGNAILAGTRAHLDPFSPGATVDRGAVYAYPTSCSKKCEPIWVDDSVGQVFSLRVAGSVILVGTNGGEFGAPALDVFPTSCATKGGPCHLLWTADLHGVCCTQTVATDTQVFAVDYLGLFAFPIDCRSDGGTCRPTWTSDLSGVLYDTPGPLIESGPPTIGDGVVFVSAGLNSGSVYAFRSDCSGACKPIWTGTAGTGAYDTIIDGDHLFVAGEDGMYAFAPRAGRPPPPAPSKSAPVFYGVLAAVALVVLLVRARRRTTSPSPQRSST
jgi:hypothetical protein